MRKQSVFAVAVCLGTLFLSAAWAVAEEKGELKADERTLALWHMNEAAWTGAGDEVKDASGNGNHGTAKGGATTTAKGRFGRCARFGAEGQYVGLPNRDGRLTLFDKSYTLEAWIKTNDAKQKWQTIYSSGPGSHSGFHCYLHGGKIYFYTYINGDHKKLKTLWSPRLEEGTWYYVAVTRDIKTGQTILYVNGARKASFKALGTSGAKDARAKTIGSRKSFFNGCIDEVRLSTVARTAKEIREHYRSAPHAPADKARPGKTTANAAPPRPASLSGRSAFASSAKLKPFKPLRTLYVSPRGNDSNDGLSPDKPMRTLVKAARRVKPGDLVLVSGGTYVGWVKLAKPGTAEHPIVWRAAPGETALLTYGNRPTGWKKVKGTRFTWSVRYKGVASTVWEDRTVTRYVSVGDLATLDELPASFHYDEAKQLLSVHCLRGSAPDEAVLVVNDHIVKMRPTKTRKFPRLYPHVKGFFVVAPYNHVEGFMVNYTPYGIQVRSAHCEIRDNTVYGCWTGIGTLYSGAGNVLENNECYLNDWNGLYVSGCSDVLVRNNLCWHNGARGPLRKRGGAVAHNLSLYGGVKNAKVVGNTAIWDGRHGHLWRYKGPSGKIVTKHNVLVGGMGLSTCNKMSLCANNTVVGGFMTQYSRSAIDGRRHPLTPEGAKKWYGGTARDNLYLKQIRNAPKACFADPGRHDYRLRVDSPHLGKGAFPDPAAVRYVSPKGNDAHDGQTPKTAWKTIAKAASSAQPGETVYVMPGTYAESVTISLKGTAEKSIAFKTYGRGYVTLDGKGRNAHGIALKGASHILLDGFIVKGFKKSCIQIEGGSDIRMVENVADGAETGIAITGARNVAVLNNTLTHCRSGLQAAGVQGQLILRNNLFADIAGSPIALDDSASGSLISEKNAFAGPKAEAQLAVWHTQVQEAHPSVATQVTLSEEYLPTTGHRLSFAGLGHKPIGARGAPPYSAPVKVEDFRAAAVFPTYAVVSLKTPCDFADAELNLKLPNGDERPLSVKQGWKVKLPVLTAKLTDLTPGKRYALRVNVYTETGRKGYAQTTFNTPTSVRGPSKLYVSTKGSDRNDGKDARHPLRTLKAAAYAACPGDNVLVGPGLYPESLTLWCSGVSEKQPLTFRSAEPGKAVIAPSRLTPNAIVIRDLKHIVIDGFRIRTATVGGVAIRLRGAEDIVFTNNISRYGCVDAWDSRRVVVRNNFFFKTWHAVSAYRCEDFTVDHNTCHRGLISGIYLRGPLDARWQVTNNIFADVIDPDKSNAVINIGNPSKNVICDYNLYWRKLCPKMGLFGFRRTRAGKPIGWSRQDAKTVDDLHKMFGIGAHSKFGDPMFMDIGKGDYRLKPGSPAVGMAADGGDVGMRNPPPWLAPRNSGL